MASCRCVWVLGLTCINWATAATVAVDAGATAINNNKGQLRVLPIDKRSTALQTVTCRTCHTVSFDRFKSLLTVTRHLKHLSTLPCNASVQPNGRMWTVPWPGPPNQQQLSAISQLQLQATVGRAFIVNDKAFGTAHDSFVSFFGRAFFGATATAMQARSFLVSM